MTTPDNARAEGLLPCPFCGDRKPKLERGRRYFVKCGGCDATTADYRHEAEAITAWNTRAPTIDRDVIEEADGREVLFVRLAYFVGCIAHASYQGWNNATIDEAKRLDAAIRALTPPANPAGEANDAD